MRNSSSIRPFGINLRIKEFGKRSFLPFFVGKEKRNEVVFCIWRKSLKKPWERVRNQENSDGTFSLAIRICNSLSKIEIKKS